MNLCMVGCGSIARMHATTLCQESVGLHTVAGRTPEPTAEFAREQGFTRWTTDLDQALAEPGIDAVVVASPSDLHFEHAEKALLAGKHVLVEVPLSIGLSRVDRLIDLAAARDLRLMVCHTHCYYPGFLMARQLIAEGRLHVHHIIYQYGFQRRANVNVVGRRRSWTDNLLWHHCCHTLYMALWLLGATDVQVMSQVAPPGGALGISMDLDVILRTPLDQLVAIAMSYNTHIPFTDCLIIGEEDTLRYSDGRLLSKDRVLCEERDPISTLSQGLADQDHEFVQAIRQGREPALAGRAVRHVYAALQAVQDQFDATTPPGARHPIP